MMAYTYTVGAIVVWIVTRIRRRPGDAVAAELPPAPADAIAARERCSASG